MARKASRLKLALPAISELMERNPKRVFTYAEMTSLLERNRTAWNVPDYVTTGNFVLTLTEYGKLRQVELSSDSHEKARIASRFVWGEVSPLAVVASIRSGAYISHGSALFLHGLTDQVPRTLYVNKEQSPKPSPDGTLTQEALDRAFSRPQRRSTFTYKYEDWNVVLLSGKNTGRLEVGPALVAGAQVDVTRVERTLIDITVRPGYAGGVFQVLEAFRAARDRVSVNTLLATLKGLDYVYPYHQAIGFYMQKAGFEPSRYERLRTLGLSFNFYLSHAMTEKEFNSEWRLFVPVGI